MVSFNSYIPPDIRCFSSTPKLPTHAQQFALSMAPPAPTTSTTITVPSSMQHPLPGLPNSRARTHKGSSMQHPYHSRPRRASPLAPAVHCTRLPQSAHSHNPTQRQSRIVPQRPTPTQSQSTHDTPQDTTVSEHDPSHTQPTTIIHPKVSSTPTHSAGYNTNAHPTRRTESLAPHILAGWVVPRW